MSRLEKTKRYELFEIHPCNRPLHATKGLIESMREHGFMPSSPIQVVRNGNGKLKVIRGHHRLHCAMRLGLPVYFVLDESNTDIFDLEGAHGQSWSVNDFVIARANAGDEDCLKVLKFRDDHGLSMGAAIALISGAGAGTSKTHMIRAGKYKAGDLTHAMRVVKVTDLCRDLGIKFYGATAFVQAVSMALRVDGFDEDTLCHRLQLYPAHLNKRGTREEYLEEIEAIYNRGARDKRIPVKFEAIRIGRELHATFGGRQAPCK